MFVKTLLFPFSVLYGWVMEIRNVLYDRGMRPSVAFDIPVICIGNLTVGGTGKTPMVEYLIRLMAPPLRIATLSRGYGRATKGYRRAGNFDNADTIGDEPFQFFRKFGDHIKVAVGEERALAIPLLLQEDPALEVIILDDAFQHRRVRPSLSILLCDYSRPFFKDLVLPAGRLRESKHNADRADIIIVTKCPPTLNEETMIEVERSIRDLTTRPVFFTSVSYSLPVPFGEGNALLSSEIILVSGIANPGPLIQHIKDHYQLVRHLSFGDHHQYRLADLEEIQQAVNEFPGASVITTEKDMVKLDTERFSAYLKRISFFYIPITVQFLKEGREFDEIVLTHVADRKEE